MLHFSSITKILTVFIIICHQIPAIELNFTIIEQEFSKLNLTIPENLKNLSKIDNSTNSTNNYNYNFNNANQIYSLKASTASCYLCTGSTSSDDSSCTSTHNCLTPDKGSTLFKQKCVTNCPSNRPYCYSFKIYIDKDPIFVDRGCANYNDNQNDFDNTPTVIGKETCSSPSLVPTDERTCELVCQEDFCNFSSRVTTSLSFSFIITLLFLIFL